MFDHIIKVALVVPDIDEAVRFYTEKLDLEVEARFPSGSGAGEDFVFLRSKTCYIELMPEKAMGAAPVGFHHVGFLVDDVDKRLEELRARNVKITAEAFDGGIGGIRLGDFEGPGKILHRLFTSDTHRRDPN